MEYLKYLEKMKSIQKYILEYIESDNDEEGNFLNLINFVKNQQIQEDKYGIKALMHLILDISNNHKRNASIFTKFDKIISQFKSEIKNYFSNYEIFNVFKKNKRILFFLLEEKIIVPDISIAITITSEKYKDALYHYYFFPEFKSYYDENLLNEIYEIYPKLFKNGEIADIEKFNENRRIGENENEVCRLIRGDMIDEFIDHLRENKILTSFEIEPSIFESNFYLLDKNPSLMEYAAFFGSANIFKYLYLTEMKLNQSLWIYSIHGKAKEILQQLKDKFVKPVDSSYKECLFESIKCHHFEITNNFLRSKKLKDVDFYPQSIKFHNYEYFPNDLNDEDDVFYLLCQYDYYPFVELLLKSMDTDINAIQILIN